MTITPKAKKYYGKIHLWILLGIAFSLFGAPNTFAQTVGHTLNITEINFSNNHQNCSNSTNIQSSQLYLNQDNDNDGIADAGLYPNLNFQISNPNKTSYIKIYREAANINNPNNSYMEYAIPESNMIYQHIGVNNIPLDATTFYRTSWVFPYNMWVRAVATAPTNKVVMERPATNINNNILTLRYGIKYQTEVSNAAGNPVLYRYNPVKDEFDNGVPTLKSWSASPKIRSTYQSQIICHDYQLHWCGDGKVDTQSYFNATATEQCDRGNNNGTPASDCSASCTSKIPTPVPLSCTLSFSQKYAFS